MFAGRKYTSLMLFHRKMGGKRLRAVGTLELVGRHLLPPFNVIGTEEG